MIRPPRPSPPARSLALALASVLLALQGCSGGGGSRPVAAPPPPVVVADPAAELVREFLSFHLYFNPVQASAAGSRDFDERLPDLSLEGAAARTSAYRGWVERLEAVDVRASSLDVEMDVRVALRAARMAVVEGEAAPANPLHSARIVRDGIELLVDGTDLGVDARLERIAARQRQLPTLLAEARRSPGGGARILTEQAIAEFEGTLQYLRRDLPFHFAGAAEAPPKWGFERSNAQAVREIEEHLAFLRDDLLPRSTGALPLGPEATDRWIRASGVAPSAGELLAEVDRALAEAGARLAVELRGLSRTVPAREMLGRLDALPLPGDSVLPVAREVLADARRFLETRGLLPVPAVTPEVRSAPLTRPADALTLEGPGRLAPEAPVLLRVDPLGGGRPVTRASVAVGVLREGGAGRLLLRDAALWVGRPLRLALPAPGEEEGWGLHAAALLLDQGFGGGDPLLRIAQLREEIRRLARLRAGVRLHRGEVTLDAAAAEVAAATGFTLPVARREMERNVHDPLEGVGALHARRYATLRQDLLDRPLQAGGPLPLDTALVVLLASGLSPDLARALLLPEPAWE